LTKILLPARRLLSEKGEMVCLIKPQFEVGRDKVGKKGVVREKKVHEEVIRKILVFARLVGFDVLDLAFSPIKGPEGNIEYLIYICKNTDMDEDVADLTEHDAEMQLKALLEENGVLPAEDENRIAKLVNQAHGKLDEEV
jgi:23S rRNA (cytidine1920-2'-O)/16S rRNA (cytidine1409-2'-O)-methyltransferase